MDLDEALALELQSQFDLENVWEAHEEVAEFLPVEFRSPTKKTTTTTTTKKESDSSSSSLVAPEWEDIDPTPDLHALFLQYNDRFFNGRLSGCEVKWSPRMTSCAGVCSYQRKAGYCSVRLSLPLLKLRPRSDLVETLLHEMIHAFLFVTDGDDDHNDHGPNFHEHMYRINREAGTKISVYHTFHDEVAHYQSHWWKCDGSCSSQKPYFGVVKRASNRKPGPYDKWFAGHHASCGGTFVKIKEPEGFGQKKPSKKQLKMEQDAKSQGDIRSFVKVGDKEAKDGSNTADRAVAVGSTKKPTNGANNDFGGGGARGNIFGFGGPSFAGTDASGGGLKTKGKTGTMVVNPGWKPPRDNSSSGHVISGPSAATGSSSSSSASAPSVSSSFALPVRQTVRDFWSKRFGGDSGTKEEDKSSTAATSSSSPEQRYCVCPVCSRKIPETAINRHLDECLNMKSLESE